MIYEISTILMESLNVREICERVVDAIFSSLGTIDGAAILLVDEQAGRYREIVAGQGTLTRDSGWITAAHCKSGGEGR